VSLFKGGVSPPSMSCGAMVRQDPERDAVDRLLAPEK